jgi:hypothetical protein
VQFCLEKLRKSNSKYGTWNGLSQSAALHDVAWRRAASRALTATHPSGPNAEAAVDLPVHAP